MNDYHNPELQKILENKITPEKYKQYAPILHEIMQRRAFEFDFPIDRMERETDALANNLEGVQYSDDDERKLPSNVAAIYNSENKYITINKEMVEKDMEAMRKYSTLSPEMLKRWTGQQIFETLTHEVYHSITLWEDKKVGLEFEEYGMTLGRELTEAMTESASARTSKIKNPNDVVKGYSRTSGYETTTYATNLLAYAMGLTQKELLANALGNKDEFLEFLKSKRPDRSPGVIENEIGLMESIFTIANKYPKGAITEEFTQQKKNGNTLGFEQMYRRIADLCRNSIFSDNRPLDMQVIGEMYARERKFTNATLNSLNDLVASRYLDEEGRMKILHGSTNDTVMTMQKMILGSYVSYKRGFEPKSIEDVCARQGYLDSLDKYYEPDEVRELLGEFNGKNLAEIEQTMLAEAQQKPEFFSYLQSVSRDDFSLNAIWDTKSYDDLYNDFEQSKDKPKENEVQNKPVSRDDDEGR